MSKIGNLKIHCIIEKITLPKVFFYVVEKKKSWHDHTMSELTLIISLVNPNDLKLNYEILFSQVIIASTKVRIFFFENLKKAVEFMNMHMDLDHWSLTTRHFGEFSQLIVHLSDDMIVCID